MCALQQPKITSNVKIDTLEVMKHFALLRNSLCLMLFMQGLFGYSQTVRFSKHYDYDNGAGGLLNIVASEDGFIAQGTNFKNGVRQSYTIKTDSDGQLLTEHAVFDSQTGYESFGLLRLSSGGLVSAGSLCDYSVPSPGYCDFYFARLDETGDTLFTKVISRPDTSDLLLSMVQTRPNKIMLIGWTYNDTTDANADILLITVDTLGNEVNRVVYGGGGTDYLRAGRVIDMAGHTFITGYTASFNGSDNDTWLVKTDSIGNVIWHMTYNHLSQSGADAGSALIKVNDNEFLLAGSFEQSGGESDNYVLMVDSLGAEQWTKRYEIPLNQGFWWGEMTEDGNLLFVGQTTNTNDGSQAGWLVKADANGDTLWTRTYNPSDATDLLRNMLLMPNGDIVMVGFGRGENSTTQDGWILRVDSMGCLEENCFTVGISPPASPQGRVAIYPNPARDVVRVSFQIPMVSIQSVSVIDMLGREIIEPTLFTSGRQVDKSVDVRGWPDGVYLITIRDEDGNRYTERLVVQH